MKGDRYIVVRMSAELRYEPSKDCRLIWLWCSREQGAQDIEAIIRKKHVDMEKEISSSNIGTVLFKEATWKST